MSDLHPPPDADARARIEAALRTAVDEHAHIAPGPARPPDGAAVAVTTACAHLHAGALEDAYLALRTAHDTIAAHYRESR